MSCALRQPQNSIGVIGVLVMDIANVDLGIRGNTAVGVVNGIEAMKNRK